MHRFVPSSWSLATIRSPWSPATRSPGRWRSSAAPGGSPTTRASRTSCSTSRRRRRVAAWKPGDPIDRELRALVVPGPELLMIEVDRLGDRGRGPRVARDRGDAAGAALRRGDERDLHHEGAPRVHRRARPARDHRPRQRADRPVAGRLVRLRRGDRPAHRPLHLVRARDPGRQRVRPPDRRASSCTSTSVATR